MLVKRKGNEVIISGPNSELHLPTRSDQPLPQEFIQAVKRIRDLHSKTKRITLIKELMEILERHGM